MKYIRTKDGRIIKIFDGDIDNEVCGIKFDIMGFRLQTTMQLNCIVKEDIVKIADTIKELCDEFVFVGQDNVPILMETLQQCLDRIKDLGLTNYKIYGAIWFQLSSGSWGLKPVAKMNEKGELELL